MPVEDRNEPLEVRGARELVDTSDARPHTDSPQKQSADLEPGPRAPQLDQQDIYDGELDVRHGHEEDLNQAELEVEDDEVDVVDDVEDVCHGPHPEGHRYEVGVSSFGQGGLIEYRPGDLPIIIGVPHGGLLEPEELAEDQGELARDTGSLEAALIVYQQLKELTGHTPHMIINHVKRNRLNLNRVDARPNMDHPIAINAYNEFHAYVDEAKRWVSATCGRGHYFDFHTNGHVERWVEVGVGLSRAQLARSDEELERAQLRRRSFYRALASDPKVSHAELIRGPMSLGGLLEREGVRVVPSPKHPSPGVGGYFSGGYNSKLHGSRYGGTIDSSQLEIHYSYIRSKGMTRQRFSHTLSVVIARFVQHHYGFELLDEAE